MREEEKQLFFDESPSREKWVPLFHEHHDIFL